ncbi:unnamed protein product [Phaeothamnion confervicola]
MVLETTQQPRWGRSSNRETAAAAVAAATAAADNGVSRDGSAAVGGNSADVLQGPALMRCVEEMRAEVAALEAEAAAAQETTAEAQLWGAELRRLRVICEREEDALAAAVTVAVVAAAEVGESSAHGASERCRSWRDNASAAHDVDGEAGGDAGGSDGSGRDDGTDGGGCEESETDDEVLLLDCDDPVTPVASPKGHTSRLSGWEEAASPEDAEEDVASPTASTAKRESEGAEDAEALICLVEDVAGTAEVDTSAEDAAMVAAHCDDPSRAAAPSSAEGQAAVADAAPALLLPMAITDGAFLAAGSENYWGSERTGGSCSGRCVPPGAAATAAAAAATVLSPCNKQPRDTTSENDNSVGSANSCSSSADSDAAPVAAAASPAAEGSKAPSRPTAATASVVVGPQSCRRSTPTMVASPKLGVGGADRKGAPRTRSGGARAGGGCSAGARAGMAAERGVAAPLL